MALAGGRGDQSHLTLKDFSTNITDMARAGHLDPLIGRNQVLAGLQCSLPCMAERQGHIVLVPRSPHA